MGNSEFVEQLLQNINNLHELGRQRAFELGNPFYAKYEGDGNHYTKELPSGERYLVDIEVIMDKDDMPLEIKDTLIKQINC
ncbi:hypothetical protein [Mucilaginibacter phyllosphaerae]